MIRSMLILSLLGAPAHADAPQTCPAAVTKAIATAFSQSTISDCKAEHEHGKDIFEVKLTRSDGKKLEVDVASNGTILQLEEKIEIDALPDAVKKAFAAKYPKAKAIGAEKQTSGKDGKDVRYEIAFQIDKSRKEATFAAEGTLLEEE